MAGGDISAVEDDEQDPDGTTDGTRLDRFCSSPDQLVFAKRIF